LKKLLVIVVCIVMVFSLAACTGAAQPAADTEETASADATGSADETVAAETASTETESAGGAEHSNKANFEYINPEGTASDLNTYYNSLGIDCDLTIRSTGGDVQWTGGSNVELPTPKEAYTIGFSVYYTVDEVGAMYLEGMQDAAEEIGINLLVNDADYDQDLQNQAIEQWILQGVDGVIMTPCDFYGCKDALDALKEAGIPVVSIDAPPCAGSVDSCVVYDCVEQGRLAAEALEKVLLSSNPDMEGVVYYGTLPFVHPNAVTRELGFKEVFDKYENIEVKTLTGESPEDHYTAFEGAIQSDPDMLGAWGLYSSATYGIMNAVKASNLDIPITSIDNDRVILEGIYNGEVLGSACYGAIEGSRLGLTQMINLLEGVNVPGIVYQTNTWVSKDNVEEMFKEYYNGATLADYIAGNN